MITALEAYQVPVNGEPRIIGKTLRCGDKTVFYRRFDWGTAYFWKDDALSFDKRVADMLDGHVSEIHYDSRGSGFYEITWDDFVDARYIDEHGEQDQYYVPVDRWTRSTHAPYEAPYTSRVVDVV